MHIALGIPPIFRGIHISFRHITDIGHSPFYSKSDVMQYALDAKADEAIANIFSHDSTLLMVFALTL